MKAGWILPLLLLAAACGGKEDPDRVAVPGRPGAYKTAAALRAERRLYDGAPPVIPHRDFGPHCASCHTEQGLHVPDLGFAPPMPHERTLGLSGKSRCLQCHVFQQTTGIFRESTFAGLRRELAPGPRLYPGAPPPIPHPLLMRENCGACHSGPAAREEIRCSHPERPRCTQCHVPSLESSEFSR
jgi:cytochrome c-type protein NapB